MAAPTPPEVPQSVAQAEADVVAEASAFQTWFTNWFPIGDHRWYVWIIVAGVAGFMLSKCV